MDSLLKEYLADGESDVVGSDHEGDGTNEKEVPVSSRETEASTLETDDAVVDAEKGHCSGSNADCEPGRRADGNGQQEGAQRRRKFKNIVAIVDPPRVGLHPVVRKWFYASSPFLSVFCDTDQDMIVFRCVNYLSCYGVCLFPVQWPPSAPRKA